MASIVCVVLPDKNSVHRTPKIILFPPTIFFPLAVWMNSPAAVVIASINSHVISLSSLSEKYTLSHPTPPRFSSIIKRP